MPQDKNLPSRKLAFIEWRASHIQDPVERLRFLRRATQTSPGRAPRLQILGRWRIAITAALWASFFIPAYSPTRARAPVRLDAFLNRTSFGYPLPRVWPVERTDHFELYSNGLRIENDFTAVAQPRVPYPVFRTGMSSLETDPLQAVEWRTEPAGIIFHSTESHQAPFDPSEIGSLKRIGRQLLGYVRAQRSYHFVIDRFGRVYRIVPETGIAKHAGKSVWSDGRVAFVNLNASFLSIALESQTESSQPVSLAQVHAARILTDMLRSKFGIPASNCVTHAQVSVNPSNMRIGYHLDWARGFPYTEVGLPDNYAQVVPSILLFGFSYDQGFTSSTGTPWAGLLAAERLVLEQAQADGLPLQVYRQRLRDRYRTIMSSPLWRWNEETSE